MPQVFISYSRHDKVFVQQLNDALKVAERETSIDIADILPAEEWAKRIDAMIRESDNFLFVITPDSVDSTQCMRELNLAVENNKRLIPILRIQPSVEMIPTALEELNWIYIREQDEFEPEITKVIETLNLDHAWVRLHTRLVVRAQEWKEHDHNSSYYLRGNDLREALGWLAAAEGRDPLPTELQRDYIQKSRTGQLHRSWSLSTGVVLALALAIWGIDRATTARSVSLADEADSFLETRPTEALRLSLEALEWRQTPQAIASLRKAIRIPVPMRIIPLDSNAENIAFSGDGRYVLTSQEDIIRNVVTGEMVVQFAPLRGLDEVASFALSPKRYRLFTVDPLGELKIWSLEKPEPLCTLPYREELECAETAAAQADRWLFKYRPGGIIRIWDRLNDGYPLDVNFQAGVGRETVRSPVGDIVAVRSDKPGVHKARTDGTVLEIGHPRSPGLSRLAMSVGFDPTGTRIVSAGEDETARVWSKHTQKELAVLEGHEHTVYRAAFSADGRFIATAGLDKRGRVWMEDEETGYVQKALLGGHDNGLYSAVFSPDGTWIATTAADSTIRIWPTADWTERVLKGDDDSSPVDKVLFSVNGEYVFTFATQGRIWDLNGRLLADLKEQGVRGVDRFAVNPDIKAALFLDASRKPAVWDFRYGVVTRLKDTSSKGQVQVKLRSWKLHYQPGEAATIQDENGKILLSLKLGSAAAGRVSKSATRLTARQHRYDLQLIDTASGDVLHNLVGHTQYIESHAFNPDQRFVVTTSQDKTARIWATDSGLPLMTLRGHTNIVSTAIFSPDSLKVLTGSWDGTARIYTCVTCRSLEDLRELARKRLDQLQ